MDRGATDLIETSISILSIVAIIVVVSLYVYKKKEKDQDWVYVVYFVTVLITGTMLYSMGLIYGEDENTTFSPLFVLGKAISAALWSFLGDFNVAALSPLAKENIFFAVACFVNFVAAVSLTALVMIKILGKKIVNAIRVIYISWRPNTVILGSSPHAMVYLNNLDATKRKRTIVILEPKNNGKKNELLNLGFSVITVRTGKPKKHTPEGKSDNYRNLYYALWYVNVFNNKHSTNVIALSEDEDYNMLAAKVIVDYIQTKVCPKKDEGGRVKALTKKQEKKCEPLKLTAHIAYSALERAEHIAFIEYALGKVRFFNIHEIMAHKFAIENPITSMIPPEWINTEKARLYDERDDGHREYRVGHIIVGFGDSNQQILKKCICNNQILGKDFNALVIDKDADRLEKQLRVIAPGLFDKKDKNGKIQYGSELMQADGNSNYFEQPKESNKIVFAKVDVNTVDFYQIVASEIAGHSGKKGYDFSQIIIALGDDKLSIETALELRQQLFDRKLLKGEIGDLKYDRVKIFVKVSEKGTITDNDLINDKYGLGNNIIVFGADSDVLTETYVVHEDLDFIAKRLANDYWEIATCGKDPGSDQCRHNVVTKWESLTEFKRDSNRFAAMAIRTKLNLLGFELMMEKSGKTRNTDEETIKAYSRAYGTEKAEKQRAEKTKATKDGSKFVDFMERDKKNKIIDNARNNLALLEHQRWNALSYVCGWTKLPKSEVTAKSRQNEKARQHACITTIDGLQELRKIQAESMIIKEKKIGTPDEEKERNRELNNADTVCYDFDVMDRLFLNLNNSNHYVIKK